MFNDPGPGFTYGVTTDHNGKMFFFFSSIFTMEAFLVVSWGLVGRLGDGRVERYQCVSSTKKKARLIPSNHVTGTQRLSYEVDSLIFRLPLVPLTLLPLKTTDAAIGDDEQLEPCAVPLFQGRHCVMLAAGPTHCLAVFEEQT